MPLYLLFISALIGTDQYLKAWAIDFLDYKDYGYQVMPYFKLYLTTNTGISFSFFASDSTTSQWILIGISSVLCLVLYTWLRRVKSTLLRLGISLILGGAIGNIIDRVEQGSVTDFIYLYYDKYTFPTFNPADIFIFIGVSLILCEDMFAKKP